MSTDINIKGDRVYRRWSKLMQLGAGTGCHQRPDRSFYFHDYQLPVCARCTGVLIGYITAVPVFILTGFHFLLSVSGCLMMFLDWLVQESGFKESNNRRRFITGLFGGFGVMTLQLFLLKRLISFLNK